MPNPAPADGEFRWARHALTARLLRWAILITPGLRRLSPSLVPLALLLDLAIAFPTRRPDRRRLARRAANGAELRAELAGRRPAAQTAQQTAERLVVLAVSPAGPESAVDPSGRVAALADLLAGRLGFTPHDRDRLAWAVLWRNHPQWSAAALDPLRPWLLDPPPTGVGELSTHVVSVAEAVAAMTAAFDSAEDRTHNRVLPAAIRRLLTASDRRVDPRVVRALITAPQRRLDSALRAWLWPDLATAWTARLVVGLVLVGGVVAALLGPAFFGLLGGLVDAASDKPTIRVVSVGMSSPSPPLSTESAPSAPTATTTPTAGPGPTSSPSLSSSVSPSGSTPAGQPGSPTSKPTSRPTTKPSTKPTTKPTTRPTTKPTTKPTGRPTIEPGGGSSAPAGGSDAPALPPPQFPPAG